MFHPDHHQFRPIFLFSGDIYLVSGICLSNPIFQLSLLTFPQLICGEFLETCNFTSNVIINENQINSYSNWIFNRIF